MTAVTRHRNRSGGGRKYRLETLVRKEKKKNLRKKNFLSKKQKKNGQTAL